MEAATGTAAGPASDWPLAQGGGSLIPELLALDARVTDCFGSRDHPARGVRTISRWPAPAAGASLDDPTREDLELPGVFASLDSTELTTRYVMPWGRPGGWRVDLGAGVDFRRTESGVSVVGATVAVIAGVSCVVSQA